MSKSSLYFAYGPSMAVRAGYRLAFHKINRADGSGKCDVLPSTNPGDSVYGALDIDPRVKPFSWYKEHVLRGAVANSLPADYLAMIQAMESHDDPDAERHARELTIYARKGHGD